MCPETSASPTAVHNQESPAAAVPNEVHAIFCGEINLINSQKLTNTLTLAINGGVTKVHLLFHSFGGFVGDGVFMYNLFSSLPIEVVIYNGGQVASAGVLAFLGAKERKTTAGGVFMIHRSQNPGQFGSAAKLKTVTDSLVLDDARSDAIFRKHLKLPKEVLDQFEHHDVNLSGEDGLKYGFVDEITNFSPPPGSKVYNALA